MNSERSLTEQIALVERKLDLRRQRTVRHWSEVQTSVRQTTEWLPLLAVAGALLLGVAAGRRRTASTLVPGAKTGLFATIVALGATAMRFALSPAGRTLWTTLRNTRRSTHR